MHHHRFIALEFDTVNQHPESACTLGVVRSGVGRMVDPTCI